MSIYTDPPEWEDAGKKPPSSKRTEGWKPGDRVPASWLNWFWFSTVNSLLEIAQAFVSHRDDMDNPHSVTKTQVGLGNVENAKQATKSEFDAHVADKNNPHGVTAEQVGAAPSTAVIPVGGIIMWSGAIDAIPSGWALCDGRNGTPDLRDRFIVGAGREYSVGDTGGAKEVTLTIDQMPRHRHVISEFGGTSMNVGLGGGRGPSTLTSTTTSYEGGGQPHENRPPYYALAYIMRVTT